MSVKQAHIISAYACVKQAMDELALVFDKDKYLFQAYSDLTRLEDLLYQYTTERRA